jgi:hypothetical protein
MCPEGRVDTARPEGVIKLSHDFVFVTHQVDEEDRANEPEHTNSRKNLLGRNKAARFPQFVSKSYRDGCNGGKPRGHSPSDLIPPAALR